MTPSTRPLTRRELIARTAAVAAATIITPALLEASPEAKEPEVTATEDLMREHGVLRRALLVYTESIPKIRADSASLDASALYRTGVLFRDFGENYHEKMLEEQHIFPVVHKGGGRGSETHRDIACAAPARTRDHQLLAVGHPGRTYRNGERRATGVLPGSLCPDVSKPRRARRYHRVPGVEEALYQQTTG